MNHVTALSNLIDVADLRKDGGKKKTRIGHVSVNNVAGTVIPGDTRFRVMVMVSFGLCYSLWS